MFNIYLHRKTSFSFWFSLISVCETKLFLYFFSYEFAGNKSIRKKIRIICKLFMHASKSFCFGILTDLLSLKERYLFCGIVYLVLHTPANTLTRPLMHPLTLTHAHNGTFCLAILTYLFICFLSLFLFFCFQFRTIWLTTKQQQ